MLSQFTNTKNYDLNFFFKKSFFAFYVSKIIVMYLLSSFFVDTQLNFSISSLSQLPTYFKSNKIYKRKLKFVSYLTRNFLALWSELSKDALCKSDVLKAVVSKRSLRPAKYCFAASQILFCGQPNIVLGPTKYCYAPRGIFIAIIFICNLINIFHL